MKNVVTTSELQGALCSATLRGEAALPLALPPPSPPAGAQARFGGHGPPRWRAPAVTHHASSTGAAVAAPHVPALVSSAASSLTLTYRSGLLLLHVQTHLATEHDGLGTRRRRGGGGEGGRRRKGGGGEEPEEEGRRGGGDGGSLAASQWKVLNRT